MQRAKDNVNFRFTLSSAHWQFENNNSTIIIIIEVLFAVAYKTCAH